MKQEPHPFAIEKIISTRILDFLPYPFLVSEVKNGTTHTVFVNRKFLEEIGYECDEIATMNEWFRKAYPDKNYRKEILTSWVNEIALAVAKGKDSVILKALVRTKSNEDRWYDVKSSVPGPIQFVAFINIQEKVSREEELQSNNENMNRILSLLSHDIRTPIATLQSLLQLTLNAALTPQEFTDKIKALNNKTFQLLDFLDTTLYWTRSNFDKVNISITETDLTGIIQKILGVYESACIEKRLRVAIKTQSITKFETDVEIVTIVLRNLLSNAIKFTPDGGQIQIHFNKTHDAHRITVQDSGLGMSPEMTQKILTDNYTSQKGTRQEKGLGIGLKLCRELLKKINAHLEIESEPGNGSRITIVLKKSHS